MESQNIRVDETASILTRRTYRPLNKNEKSLTSFIVEFLIPEPMPVDGRQSLSEYDTIARLVIQFYEEIIDYMLI